MEKQGKNKSVWLRWWLILCVNLAGPQFPDIWTNVILYVFMKVFFGWDEHLNQWTLRLQITLHKMESLMQFSEDFNRTKTDLLPARRNSVSRQPLDLNWTFSCVSSLPVYSIRFWTHHTHNSVSQFLKINLSLSHSHIHTFTHPVGSTSLENPD